jgi:hypothetical protein
MARDEKVETAVRDRQFGGFRHQVREENFFANVRVLPFQVFRPRPVDARPRMDGKTAPQRSNLHTATAQMPPQIAVFEPA